MNIRNMRIPIRFKILIALLIVITGVVSIITFTMANLFHTDKTAYIHDLTSVIALHTTQEAESMMLGYQERLQVYGRVLTDGKLSKEQKSALLRELVTDSSDFVAVSLYRDDKVEAALFDNEELEKAGLSAERVSAWQREHRPPKQYLAPGKVFVENSTMTPKLPTFNITRSLPSRSGTATLLVATVRLDRFLTLSREAKSFEIFMLDSKGALLAHTKEALVIGHSLPEWLPKLENLDSQVRTVEYARGKIEYVGGFSRVSSGDLLVGVQIPKSAAYLTARNLLNNLIGVALALILVAAASSIFWSRLITRPLERLSAASRVVGTGNFDIQLPVNNNDEIGDLAGSFNQMATELKSRDETLQRAQAQLVQSEKMAAFGQLGAGIAHEVKNPLGGILGFAQLSMRKLDKDTPLYKNLQTIEKETKRCREIIDNLLKFSRQESVDFSLVDIHHVIDDAVSIVAHQLGVNKVMLEQEVSPELPQVYGSANQLEQVLINFLINAQQAMDGAPGTVRVLARPLENGGVELRVSDNGPGIPKDIQAKLFDPFFTTKEAGKGTGLGLSVTYGIIKEHAGEVRVESEPGAGASFIVTLPPAPSLHESNGKVTENNLPVEV